MAIANRLKWVLDSHGIEYELVHHSHTRSSLESAQAAHVPGGRIAKSVLLEDERGYVLAIVPASCRIDFDEIASEMGRKLELATEAELGSLFPDCEPGAVPPLGSAFPIPTAIDRSLTRMPDVYFEAGDHEDLVHISGDSFRALFGSAREGHFGRPH